MVHMKIVKTKYLNLVKRTVDDENLIGRIN